VAKWLHYADVTMNTELCWLCKELDIRAAGPVSRFYNCSFKRKKRFLSKVLEIHGVLVLNTLVEICIADRRESDTAESKVPLHQALVSRKPCIVMRDKVSYYPKSHNRILRIQYSFTTYVRRH
jgi:hypothetical protein